MSITSEGQQVTDSLNGKLTFEQDKNRIVGRDEDNKIGLLIGTDPFVVKIAKDGFDALTADNDDLIFNSNRNLFKIEDVITGTVTPPFTGSPPNTQSGTHKVSIAHGQGQAPAILPYVSPPASYGIGNQFPAPWILPGNDPDGGGNGIFVMASVEVNATDVVLKVYQRSNTDYSPSSANYDFKVYILSETAN